MKKAITIGIPILWVAALVVLDAHAQAGGGAKEPPELAAVAQMVEAEGKLAEVTVEEGELLGLANKEPVPAKRFGLVDTGIERLAMTFSYEGKVWVAFATFTYRPYGREAAMRANKSLSQRADRTFTSLIVADTGLPRGDFRRHTPLLRA